MGIWDKIKEETGINSASEEIDRFGGRVESEINRTDENVEHITGLSTEEIGVGLATGGASLLAPGIVSGLAGSNVAGLVTSGGGPSLESVTAGLNSGAVDPRELAAAYGYTEREDIEQFLKDPTGAIAAAEKAAERIRELQQTSAGRAILQQESNLSNIEGLTQPFRDVATDVAIPQLSALALGGETNFQQSDLSKRQLSSGREGILKNRAAGPGIKASGTFKNLADLASKLSAEDVGRFEQGNIDLLNTGLRGEDILRSAETAVAGAGSDIYRGVGQSLNAASQNVANAQLSNAQTLASGASSLSSLALLRGD